MFYIPSNKDYTENQIKLFGSLGKEIPYALNQSKIHIFSDYKGLLFVHKCQPNDTKVFKVLIDMDENGKEIKPSMTTDNRIILTSLDNVVKIPRNCLFSNNGDNYVFLKSGGKIWKKRVVAGPENSEEIV